MKITVPLRNYHDVEALIESGADDFFCGVQHRTSDNHFYYNLNRRTTVDANFQSFADLTKAVALAHKLNTRVSLTVNEKFSKKQYPYVDEMIKNADKAGVDGLIISDFGLLLYLHHLKLTDRFYITMGTGAVNYNTQTVQLYKKHNARGITLSRKMYPAEIIDLQKKIAGLGITTKAFMQANGYCPNLDGLCSFQHAKDKRSHYGACGSLQTCYRTLTRGSLDEHMTETYFGNCKICFLYELVKIKTDSIKLLDRTSTLKKMKVLIPLMKTLISKAKQIPTKHQFVLYVVNNYLDKIPHIDCKKDDCHFKNDFLNEYE